MALTKTNYELKEVGITLSKAYAFIHDLRIDGDSGIAEFYIQNSPRDNAFNLQPLQKVKIYFTVNRSENPFTTAYNEAKGTTTKSRYNEETNEIEYYEDPNFFNGWDDDLVS